MAYGKVTEDTVYTCTGHPLRSDIANILDWSLNKDFTTAYKRILPWPLEALYIRQCVCSVKPNVAVRLDLSLFKSRSSVLPSSNLNVFFHLYY